MGKLKGTYELYGRVERLRGGVELQDFDFEIVKSFKERLRGIKIFVKAMYC